MSYILWLQTAMSLAEITKKSEAIRQALKLYLPNLTILTRDRVKDLESAVLHPSATQIAMVMLENLLPVVLAPVFFNQHGPAVLFLIAGLETQFAKFAKNNSSLAASLVDVTCLQLKIYKRIQDDLINMLATLTKFREALVRQAAADRPENKKKDNGNTVDTQSQIKIIFALIKNIRTQNKALTAMKISTVSASRSLKSECKDTSKKNQKKAPAIKLSQGMNTVSMVKNTPLAEFDKQQLEKDCRYLIDNNTSLDAQKARELLMRFSALSIRQSTASWYGLVKEVIARGGFNLAALEVKHAAKRQQKTPADVVNPYRWHQGAEALLSLFWHHGDQLDPSDVSVNLSKVKASGQQLLSFLQTVSANTQFYKGVLSKYYSALIQLLGQVESQVGFVLDLPRILVGPVTVADKSQWKPTKLLGGGLGEFFTNLFFNPWGRVRSRLVLLQDGRFANGYLNKVEVWDANKGCRELTLDSHSSGEITCLAILNDGQLVGGADDGMISVWNVKTGNMNLRTVIPAKSSAESWTAKISSLVVLKDGRLVASSMRATYVFDPEKWNVTMAPYFKHILPEYKRAPMLVVLRDGRLASASSYPDIRRGMIIKVWNVTTWQCELTMKWERRINRLLALRDGRLASLNYDGVIALWDVNSGVRLKELEIPKQFESAGCLTELPDGRLVGGDVHGLIYVWDVRTGRCEQLDIVDNHRPRPIMDLMPLRDGRVIGLTLDMSTNVLIKVWDLGVRYREEGARSVIPAGGFASKLREIQAYIAKNRPDALNKGHARLQTWRANQGKSALALLSQQYRFVQQSLELGFKHHPAYTDWCRRLTINHIHRDSFKQGVIPTKSEAKETQQTKPFILIQILTQLCAIEAVATEVRAAIKNASKKDIIGAYASQVMRMLREIEIFERLNLPQSTLKISLPSQRTTAVVPRIFHRFAAPGIRSTVEGTSKIILHTARLASEGINGSDEETNRMQPLTHLRRRNIRR